MPTIMSSAHQEKVCGIALRQMSRTITRLRKTMFFQNVCQLVSTSASPKQPQSETGLVRAIHSVSGVITR